MNRSRLPAQAREGLIRAWLQILAERHPEVTWITQDSPSEEAADCEDSAERGHVAA